MSASNNRRWIVLLNKVPRGPLTEAEVRALLREGLLRHNDTAFLVPEDGPAGEPKPVAQWKLLWQFPEFDRRLEEEGNRTPKPQAAYAGTSTPPAAPAQGGAHERRRQMPAEEAEQKAREAVPEEIRDISPEELVIHSTSQEKVELPDAPMEGPPATVDLHMPQMRTVGMVGGMIVALAAVWFLLSAPPSSAPPRPNVRTPAAATRTAVPTRGRPRMELPGRRSPQSPPQIQSAPPTLPEARVPAADSLRDLLPSVSDEGERSPDSREDEDEEDSGFRDEEFPDEEIRPVRRRLKRVVPPRDNAEEGSDADAADEGDYEEE